VEITKGDKAPYTGTLMPHDMADFYHTRSLELDICNNRCKAPEHQEPVSSFERDALIFFIGASVGILSFTLISK
jgi:hypothetical protein